MNINATEFLTSVQKNQLLTSIDNTCGDTWCEGDFDFSFDSVNCSKEKHSCTFTFDLLWYWDLDDDLDYNQRQEQAPRHTATCTLYGYDRYDQMMESVSARYSDLVWEFYEEFSDKCVTPAEEQAYQVLDLK